MCFLAAFLFISVFLWIECILVCQKKNELKTDRVYAPLVFPAALLTIVRIWKQPKCPLTEECTKRPRCIYTAEYYAAVKKERSLAVCDNVRGPVMVSEVSQPEKDRYRMISIIFEI